MVITFRIGFILILFIANINAKLLFVFEHARHGARAPWEKVDDKGFDPFGEQWSGLGEITGAGLRMHYLLGSRNKNYYDGFLNKDYDPREILVYSTDINRTIQSAQSQLQGLYAYNSSINLTDTQLTRFKIPFGDNYTIELNDIKKRLEYYPLPNGIQLIPVHILNDKNILYYMNDDSMCPRIGELKMKGRATKEQTELYNNITHKFNDTYGQQLLTFFNITDPNYFFNKEAIWGPAYSFCDGFISDYSDGRELSIFKEKTQIDLDDLYDDCKEIVFNEVFVFNALDPPDFEIIKIGLSPLMRSIINWMDNKIQADKEGTLDIPNYKRPKFVLVSGHDTTLSLLSIVMERLFGFEVEFVGFASNQYLELSKEDDNEYYVQYIFQEHSFPKIKFADFKKTLLDENLMEDNEINDFCEVGPIRKKNHLKLFKALTFGFVALCVINLVIFIIQIFKKWKNSRPIDSGDIPNDFGASGLLGE